MGQHDGPARPGHAGERSVSVRIEDAAEVVLRLARERADALTCWRRRVAAEAAIRAVRDALKR